MSSSVASAVTDTITVADFERFRTLFYRKTGIHFEDSKRYFVDKRLRERMKQTGHETFKNYFTFMRFQASGEEFQNLTNAMTVNETYFFREDYQFQTMCKYLMDELDGQRPQGQDLRIWSVPSSTGEEPYSIAIFLMEFWKGLAHRDVELVSSDIDTSVLARAKAGIYSKRSVQNIPITIRQKYFTQQGQEFHLCDDIRESVSFSLANLVGTQNTKSFRSFDLIFCRNLLIYFDDDSRRQAAQVLYDALNPGGYIFLGHSESMSRISSLFKVRKFGDVIVYQKPLFEGDRV
ncbi:CheR family methyltransferase [Salinimonas lutimaris]|uniref:CheR family methyltransferase n=1 Tax=Salinimonas lutimaris TaxID=914153 RepID=UPI0010BF6FDD|nr:protein-glutamate O-methyltransferase CheR [Salinimonas lutimaris]